MIVFGLQELVDLEDKKLTASKRILKRALTERSADHREQKASSRAKTETHMGKSILEACTVRGGTT